MEDNKQALSTILNKYGVPDPKIVGKLPKGGMQLDFVGHADVTKMLIEIDPAWTMEPVAFDSDGLPAYRVENGMAHMACWMTIHGVRRLGIGSVMHNKPDLLKELQSDAIRNCGMRFGICLSLWTKQEWDDVDNHKPARQQLGNAVNKPIPSKQAAPATEEAEFLTNEQRQQFVGACARVALDPVQVAKAANISWDGDIKQTDLPALRESYNSLKAAKENS